MKKHKLLKTIGIFFLVVVALTWIIPTGAYSGSEFTKGVTEPMGLLDLFRLPFMTIGTFVQYGLVFLAIGGFYEVLNKTGVYAPLVEKIANKWKGKEKVFLAIVVVFFALLASLSALTLPLFILVPFFVTIILLMGLSKLTALTSTVGAILIGMIGSTYGFNASGYVNYFLSLDVNNQIFTKIILFVMLVVLLVFFVMQNAKKELLKEVKKEASKKETKKKALKKEEVIVEANNQREIPFYDETIKNKKSAVPMIIVTSLAIIISLLCMFKWFYAFKIQFFQDIYTSLMEIKVGEYPIMSNLLGGLAAFGSWENYELLVVLVLTSLLIGWIYSVKAGDILDGFLEGSKKMIGVAFYAIICNVVFAVILSSESGTIFNTINNFFLELTKSFNVFTTAISTFIGGVLYNDFYYLVSGMSGVVSSKFDATTLPVVGLVLQTIYGFAMLLLPTSIILIAGLRYLEVSYKEWIKYIWKFLLTVLVVILVVLVIAALFI